MYRCFFLVSFKMIMKVSSLGFNDHEGSSDLVVNDHESLKVVGNEK
jgi:hypothetical protein